MRITKLVLSGYKRLVLNNIRHFEYTPENIYQLILGTNGSGKSSILSELSPLPGVPADYVRDGYKEIHIDHNGSSFLLVSTFKSSNKHSFVKDGEEFNPGGTGSVQKELVKKEFGVTLDIRNLLIGFTQFTSMSPAKRREWITSMSSVSYTYALTVHKALKSAARDAQGALKHNKQRSADETAKLQDIGDLAGIENRYQKLHDELNTLFTEKDATTENVRSLEAELDRLMPEIDELCQVIIDKKPQMPKGFSFNSVEEIAEARQEAQTQYQVNISLRNQVGSEKEELQQLIDNFEQAGVEDLSSVKTQRADLEKELDRYRSQIEQWTEIEGSAAEIQKEYYSAATPVVQVLNSLPENGDRKFSGSNLREAKEKLPKIKHQVESTTNKLVKRQSQLDHLDSLREETCPKCGHQWVPGKSDKEAADLEKTIDQLKKDLVAVEKEQSITEDYIEAAESYSQLYSSFKNITQSYPRLYQLWSTLLNEERLLTDPRSLVELVNVFGRDIDQYVEIEAIEGRIAKLDKLLATSDESGRLDGLRKRLSDLETRLETITAELSNASRQIEQFDKLDKHLKAYKQREQWLEERLDKLHKLRDRLVEAYRNEAINQTIHQHQNELGSLQHQRTQKQTLESVIADLEDHREELADQQEILSILANELSPTEGLIAEQLRGFIGSFVDHVNEVIGEIWSYDLRVLPCGIDSNDLDYKFPLVVRKEGVENQPSDISEGSEAQVEVVNLAFRLVMMVYLGLEDFPVYLDEAGRAFDEQHRLNLLNFVKQLVDTGKYTQLFIVSHYMASFNIYHNAEVLVLDSSNITVPKSYNTHAVLE